MSLTLLNDDGRTLARADLPVGRLEEDAETRLRVDLLPYNADAVKAAAAAVLAEAAMWGADTPTPAFVAVPQAAPIVVAHVETTMHVLPVPALPVPVPRPPLPPYAMPSHPQQALGAVLPFPMGAPSPQWMAQAPVSLIGPDLRVQPPTLQLLAPAPIIAIQLLPPAANDYNSPYFSGGFGYRGYDSFGGLGLGASTSGFAATGPMVSPWGWSDGWGWRHRRGGRW
jgi:hypothetical protein